MSEPTTKGETKLSVGQGWLVRWQLQGDHWLDFQAYEVLGLRRYVVGAGYENEEGVPTYRLKGARDDSDTESVDEAEPRITGFVKWDGCAEMMIGNPHFCGAGDIAEFTEVMRQLHALALRIPNIDPRVADYDGLATTRLTTHEFTELMVSLVEWGIVMRDGYYRADGEA